MSTARARAKQFLSKIVGGVAAKIVVDGIVFVLFPTGIGASLLVVFPQLRKWIARVLVLPLPLYGVLVSVFLTILACYLLSKWNPIRDSIRLRRRFKYLSSEEKFCLYEHYIRPQRKVAVFHDHHPTATHLATQGILYQGEYVAPLSFDTYFHIQEWAWRTLIDHQHLLETK
jgi:hypothetical protein